MMLNSLVIFATLAIAVSAFSLPQVRHQDVSGLSSEEYEKLVDQCLSDWRECANLDGQNVNTAYCHACINSCGKQSFPNPNRTPELCTQLQEYCYTYATAPPPPGPTCYSSTCISYYNRCKNPQHYLNTLDTQNACLYCGSSCTECPALYDECMGTSGSQGTGKCNNESCTYYAQLCKNSPNSSFCGYCEAACEQSPTCAVETNFCKAGGVHH